MRLSSRIGFTFLLAAACPAAVEPYSIGEPTDEEQYYLELINRARANPIAESLRLAAITDPLSLQAMAFYRVNLNLFKAEMALIPPRPPLAMNPYLVQAAQTHSQYMFTVAQQTHNGPGGASWDERGTAAGYTYQVVLENIYASTASPDYGHAGLEIDWGPGGTGGMLPGRVHRNSIHYAGVKEVGIGLFSGYKVAGGRAFGPQLVTQDFGAGPPDQVFVTGVVYHDLNGNDFYDPGEGLGNVSVEVGDGAYLGITAVSGGYAVPVPKTAAEHQVRFTGPAIDSSASVVISGHNVKLDLKLAYTPPRISGPPVPAVGLPGTYTISPVAGATTYQWKHYTEEPVPLDSAENSSRLASAPSGQGAVISTAAKFDGSASYYLVHPATPVDVAATYSNTFQVGASASISFRSRLGYARSGEVARVQASADDGASWITVYSQTGTNGIGETSFQPRTVNLSAFAGEEIRLRFFYDYLSGPIYAPGTGVGWWVDQIVFTDLNRTAGVAISDAGADRTFQFSPPAAGLYRLAARPLFPGRAGAYGPVADAAATVQNTYPTWAAAQELTLGLPAGSLAEDPEGDSNGDGVPNLMAYALGRPPDQWLANELPRPEISKEVIQIEYRKNPMLQDLDWRAEASRGLGAWSPPGGPTAPPGFIDELVSTEGGFETRRASLPVIEGAVGYLRLKAALQEITSPTGP